MERDPRVDPRPGDVLRVRNYRIVERIEPLRGVWWTNNGGKLHGCTRYASFEAWQKWAAKATVCK